MRIVANIAGLLLGLAFCAFGLMFLLGMVPEQAPPPEGSPVALFMGAFVPTGYLTFVKVCEVLGGLLVMVPRTRNLGLLLLGPVLVNILAFHVFVAGDGVSDPIVLTLCALALLLLFAERKTWAGLVTRGRS
jgi:putative oxidoreductase